MQWFTHKTVTLAGALAVGAPAIGLVGALVGSVLPDMADTALAGGNQQRWRRLHRQTTHWFGWYLGIIAVGVWLSARGLGDAGGASAVADALEGLARSLGLKRLTGAGEAGARLLGDAVIWIGLGGLSHILLDSPTPMGVPLLPQGGRRRFGLGLVRTGSLAERLFLIVALGLIAAQFREVRDLFALVLRRLG